MEFFIWMYILYQQIQIYIFCVAKIGDRAKQKIQNMHKRIQIIIF